MTFKTNLMRLSIVIESSFFKVTDDFFRQVTFGTAVTPGARIFIRRIFPIQVG
jgi:hypothetical protein